MDKRKKQTSIAGIIAVGLITMFALGILPLIWWNIDGPEKQEDVGPVYDFCLLWKKNLEGLDKCEYSNRMAFHDGSECTSFEMDSTGKEFCERGFRKYLDEGE